MKYLIRILWLIGVPIITMLIVAILCATSLLAPIVCAIYFVIKGELPEEYMYKIGKFLDTIIEKYHKLKEYGN